MGMLFPSNLKKKSLADEGYTLAIGVENVVHENIVVLVVVEPVDFAVFAVFVAEIVIVALIAADELPVGFVGESLAVAPADVVVVSAALALADVIVLGSVFDGVHCLVENVLKTVVHVDFEREIIDCSFDDVECSFHNL